MRALDLELGIARRHFKEHGWVEKDGYLTHTMVPYYDSEEEVEADKLGAGWWGVGVVVLMADLESLLVGHEGARRFAYADATGKPVRTGMNTPGQDHHRRLARPSTAPRAFDRFQLV